MGKQFYVSGFRCSACGEEWSWCAGVAEPCYTCGAVGTRIESVERIERRRGTFSEVLLGVLFGDTVECSVGWSPMGPGTDLDGACAYCGGSDNRCPRCGAPADTSQAREA